MSISVYDQSIARMSHMLRNLDNLISKAEAYAEEKNIEPAALLQARLAGTDMPSWSDDEESFADVHARINKSIDFLATFKPGQFEGSETKEIELKLGSHTINFNGQSYLLNFVLPNLYFHITTAYNLLRHSGVDLGKRDFIG